MPDLFCVAAENRMVAGILRSKFGVPEFGKASSGKTCFLCMVAFKSKYLAFENNYRRCAREKMGHDVLPISKK